MATIRANENDTHIAADDSMLNVGPGAATGWLPNSLGTWESAVGTPTSIRASFGGVYTYIGRNFHYDNETGALDGGLITAIRAGYGPVADFGRITVADYHDLIDTNSMNAWMLSGNDRIFGAAAADIIDGYLGNDYITGKDGNDVLNGGDGNDRIEGGRGNDVLTGGAGDGDSDVLIGGHNSDTYNVEAGDVVIEKHEHGVDLINSLGSRALGAHQENLTLTDMGIADDDDHCNGYGNGLNNIIRGDGNVDVDANGDAILNTIAG
ncbi:MAG: hypothetical protein HQM02_10200, partial [Magnetococcales bacterium]|nr:hypothetical protein [Magnetococcales bacterium]